MEMKKRHVDVASSTADKGKHVQSLFIPFSLLGCFKKKLFIFFNNCQSGNSADHTSTFLTVTL